MSAKTMSAIMATFLFVLFLICGQPARAVLSGKLDLGSTPKGFVFRDAQNGQWRAGYNKALFALNMNNKELLSLGYNHTWNAEKGNPAMGLSLGKHVSLGQVGGLLNLADLSMPPFLQYIGKVVSLNGVVAYMPVHTKDVNGPMIWGAGAEVDMSDLFGLLQRGL